MKNAPMPSPHLALSKGQTLRTPQGVGYWSRLVQFCPEAFCSTHSSIVLLPSVKGKDDQHGLGWQSQSESQGALGLKLCPLIEAA